MTPSTSTVLAAPEPLEVGFGSTDAATTSAIRRRRWTASLAPATTGFKYPKAPSYHHTSPVEDFFTTYLSTEADWAAVQLWRQCRSLVVHSPTLIAKTPALRMSPLSFFTEGLLERHCLLPVRWSFADAFGSATSENIHQVIDILNWTDPLSEPSSLAVRRVADLLAAAVEETFEDGVESSFSQGLAALFKSHKVATLAAVEAVVLSPDTNVEVAVEAIRLLGELEDLTSRPYRRGLLEKLLASPSARLRHAAASGLAVMDDPESLPALTAAFDREGNRRLRQYFELVVDQLERRR